MNWCHEFCIVVANVSSNPGSTILWICAAGEILVPVSSPVTEQSNCPYVTGMRGLNDSTHPGPWEWYPVLSSGQLKPPAPPIPESHNYTQDINLFYT